VSKELHAAEERWAQIVRERDVAAAESFLADDFVLQSAGGVSPNAPKSDWIETLQQIETRSLDPSDIEARVFGDVAVVRLRLAWEAELAGRDLTGDYAIVDVFTRSSDGWHPRWRISTRLTG
jgi:ketosteroid isomerase-like protein